MPENIPTPAGFTGKDLTGERFGRLIAFEFSHWNETPTGRKLQMWKCRCDCGNMIVTMKWSLLSGKTKSCGCLRKELMRAAQTKHGHVGRVAGKKVRSRTYRAWCKMRERCLTKTNKDYDKYAGRNISVCDRWSHPDSFPNFLEDMGECPAGLTLHRVDNDGNYEPGNCIWADWTTQNNCKRNNRMETAFGQTKTRSQWARDYSLSYQDLRYWANKLGIEQALTMLCPERIKAMS